MERLREARCHLERPKHQLLLLTSVCSAIIRDAIGGWHWAHHSMHLCQPTREQAHWGGGAHNNPTWAPYSGSQHIDPGVLLQAVWDRCKKRSINRRMGEKERRGPDYL